MAQIISPGETAKRAILATGIERGRTQMHLRAHIAMRCAAPVRGFTLIEILVVIAIMAVLAATVSIAITGGAERALQREAERAQALITYACERAELSGRDIGLSFDATGYRFSYYDRDVWTPYRSDELRARTWPANISAILTRDNQRIALERKFPEKPQLRCDGAGELTAFRIDLVLPDSTVFYRLDAGADGQVVLAQNATRAR